MAKYKQYEEYKNIDEFTTNYIPSHWVSKKLKWEITAKSGTDEKKDSGLFDLYGANGIIGKTSTFINNKFDPKVLIGRVGSAGAINYLVEQAGVSDNAIVIENIKYNFPKFDYYLLKSLNLQELVSKNAQPLITASNIKDILVAVPEDENERVTIANFLDHETAQIDTLIEKQQTLITLLKEKRQAIISHAVTKGLNPDAPMKDSGVEWLGDVPEGWEVKRVRHAFDIDNNLRTPINRQARSEMEGDFRYYGPTGVLNLINRYNVEGQYFLLGEDGDHFLKFEEKPMTIYVEGKFNVNNHAHLIKGKGKCSTKWGCLYFEHKDLFPWLIKQGVGRYKLQKTVLLDIPVAIPPLDEQEFILNTVNKKKNDFSEIEKRTEALINLLKERRTALISAAVTGKIDVRGWRK